MSFAGRWIRRVRNESSTDPHSRIRTWVRLFRLILLIPSWESQCAHPEEKRDPRKTFIPESSKRLTSTRRIEKDSLTQIIAAGSCDEDCGEECMSTSIVSCCDTSPVLDHAEHVFDAVALLVEHIVIVVGSRRFFLGEMQGEIPLSFNPLRSHDRQSTPWLWAGDRAVVGHLVITHLARSQQERQWPSPAIGDGMQLGIQATLRSSDAAGKSPFFSRLAAVRWALRWVASIINRSGWPALPASASTIRLKTPNSLHRMKRLYNVL